MYCQKHLYVNNINFENLVDTLELAIENEAEELENECWKYAEDHAKNIIKSEKWKDFICSNPTPFAVFLHNMVYNYSTEIRAHCEEGIVQEPEDGSQEQVTYSTKEFLETHFPQETLFRDFERLFTESLFTDLELEIDGQILKAHKIILTGKIGIWVSFDFLVSKFQKNIQFTH